MNEKTEGKIVYDVVCEGMSLNYDQGSGNLQELKKIVMPNGMIHTLISKYALRYSVLESMNGFSEGKNLKAKNDKEGGNQVIQASLKSLLDGSLFDQPEFVLFGFLITEPQIQRENPTKITHAISLTPYNNDILFYANHSFAKRYMDHEKKTSLSPNPFNKEEHHSLYGYTVVVDVEKMKKFEFFVDDKSIKDAGIEKEIDDAFKKGSKHRKDSGKVEITFEKVEGTEQNKKKSKVFKITVEIKDEHLKNCIKNLENAIINLKRNHQGKQADLKPKILIVQKLNKEDKYCTYLDRIKVSSEIREEVKVTREKPEGKDGEEEIISTTKKTLRGLELDLDLESGFKSDKIPLLSNGTSSPEDNDKCKWIYIDGTRKDTGHNGMGHWDLNTLAMRTFLNLSLKTD